MSQLFDKKNSIPKGCVVAPDLYDTRVQNLFTKMGRIQAKDIKSHKEALSDDSELGEFADFDVIVGEGRAVAAKEEASADSSSETSEVQSDVVANYTSGHGGSQEF